MIAVIAVPGQLPCIVLHTGREGLSVKVKTYCGEKLAASDGVYQVPDNHKVCAECKVKVKELESEAK